jgi:cysteine desulfurase/selenocysteine lyase
MQSAYSGTSAWINIMSTSDPGSAERAALADQESGALTNDGRSAAMASLPDPAVIARLANEFFAALPGNVSTENVGASAPARATAETLPAVPQFVPSPPAEANPQALAQKASEVPQSPAAPGSLAYFLDHTSPLNLSPSLPSPNDAFSLPGAPGAQAMPGIPAMPASLPGAPLSEAELRAIPASLGSVPAFAPAVPPSAPSPEMGSSAFFLNPEQTAPLAAAPSFSGATETFSFPGVPLAGVPGTPSVPEIPGLPSSPPSNRHSLPAAASTSAVPGTPSFFPGAAKAPAARPLSIASLEFRPDLVPDMGLSARPFDPYMIRRDFPILQEQVNGRPLVWLDNAATTQKPNAVIDRVSYFYRHENSNIHRAAHTLAARATDAYEGAREKVRRFLNASSTREIVFVRGATEGINLVAKSWGQRNVQKDDEIVITWLEHHANIVPWQQLCSAKGARLRVAPVNDRGEVILEEYEKLLGPRTRIVAFSQVSNALGTITPAKEMVEMAHRHGARVLVDGAQSIAHMGVNVQLLDCDFFVFSGHKIFAPTGIGVVFGKADLLDTTPPWQGGGSMIVDVTFEKTIYNVAPARFEAGTGNIADAVGLGAALDYLEQIGMENIARYEHDLLQYATTKLLTVPGLHLIGTAREKAGVLSFVLDGFRTEDVGKELNQEGIAVRAGHHCAQPILRRFGLESTVRPSLALYNTCEDVDALIAALMRIQTGRGHRGL